MSDKPTKKPRAKRAAPKVRSLVTRGEARADMGDDEIRAENSKLVAGLLSHKIQLDTQVAKLLTIAVTNGAPLVHGTFALPTNQDGVHRVVKLVLAYGEEAAAAVDAALEIIQDDDEDEGPSVHHPRR